MSDWCDLKPDKWGPSGRRGGVDIKPNGNTLRSKKSIRWRVECGDRGHMASGWATVGWLLRRVLCGRSKTSFECFEQKGVRPIDITFS